MRIRKIEPSQEVNEAEQRSVEKWKGMMRRLPQLLEEKGQERFNFALIQALQEMGLRPELLKGGKLEFKAAPENVEHIMRERFILPMISFSNFVDYQEFMRHLGYENPPQGVAVGLNFKTFLSYLDLEIPPGSLRHLHIILHCEEERSGAMPPDQILRHESVHAVDPILEIRKNPDGLILAEMIATIGEFAMPETDHFSLRTLPGFWLGYLSHIIASAQSKGVLPFTPAFLRVFRLSHPLTLEGIVEGIINFIRELTSKKKNSEIVRLMMECKSFEDLENRLKVSGDLPESQKVVEATRELTEEALKSIFIRVLSYYNNWPTAYQFQDRSLSSLWQAPDYARQAMQPFLMEDADLAKMALELLSRASGYAFDLSGIFEFKVEQMQKGSNYQVTIRW